MQKYSTKFECFSCMSYVSSTPMWFVETVTSEQWTFDLITVTACPSEREQPEITERWNQNVLPKLFLLPFDLDVCPVETQMPLFTFGEKQICINLSSLLLIVQNCCSICGSFREENLGNSWRDVSLFLCNATYCRICYFCCTILTLFICKITLQTSAPSLPFATRWALSSI